MSRKSHIKHTEKKSPDLFPAASGAKSLTAKSHAGANSIDRFATAAQLLPITDMDYAALSRLAHKLNPALTPPAPWIPAPRGARWDLIPTLAGCLAWERHQRATAEARALPRQCASMRDTEAVFHLPIEMQQHAREHFHPKEGDEIIFEASNRVNILPMLRYFKPLLKKLFSSGGAPLKDLEGFEDLDVDFQRARCLQQDEIEKRRNNALATAQLHTRDGIEKELAEPLAQIFGVLKNYEKITGGKLKSLLASAGVPPEIVRQAIATAAAGIQEPFTKLRDQLELNQTDNSKAA